MQDQCQARPSPWHAVSAQLSRSRCDLLPKESAGDAGPFSDGLWVMGLDRERRLPKVLGRARTGGAPRNAPPVEAEAVVDVAHVEGLLGCRGGELLEEDAVEEADPARCQGLGGLPHDLVVGFCELEELGDEPPVVASMNRHPFAHLLGEEIGHPSDG